ncbi:nucleotidyltransferase family protein [Gloeobacter kilaueensis]|uniref:Nucleotidyltransferase domain-containing protein n=1 Tax=Gloeobacter kilaueensis (strain ATCC BAA-2537 / CCAP 1431/1 / ULC 316 / JS1) TaxID=1183438 RepID=U5QPF0_GLOK1|nr:nucleotidyltransferase domain-containing protein [Gloeobacter kilaueensis JS1]
MVFARQSEPFPTWSHPPRRQEVLDCLRRHWSQLQAFGVKSIALFGSVVRDEARRDSDVDLLVEFEPGEVVTFARFFELQDFLEALLQRPVDLGTPSSLKPRIAASVFKELIYVQP